MKVTVLGCGTSGGVPRAPEMWGECDPSEIKNRRSRASVALEIEGQSFIIDTTPDLRMQCLGNHIRKLDAVFYTHDHADHCHGIDDIRGFAQDQKKPIPLYSDAETLNVLRSRFGYIFDGAPGYPALGIACPLKPGAHRINGVDMVVFHQQHGPDAYSLGYRFGDFAYSTDVNGLDETAFKALAGVKIWVVDALRRKPHPTHAHLAQTLGWIERVKPDLAILTHMAWDMDYRTLLNNLPDNIRPGFDGMILDL